MKYTVVVSNYWIGKVKYQRGDIVEMSEEEFSRHGTKLHPYTEPPKAKRKTKSAKKSGDPSMDNQIKKSGGPSMDNQVKISGDPCMDNQVSGVENEEV